MNVGIGSKLYFKPKFCRFLCYLLYFMIKVRTVADLVAWNGGGARNKKSMWPPLVAIFLMTYFYRASRPWPPRPPASTTAVSGKYRFISRNIDLRKCEWHDVIRN